MKSQVHGRGRGRTKRTRALNRMSIAARAKELGVSTRTLKAEIAAGRGPLVTHVSLKVKRIEDEPWKAWRLERRENPPAEVLCVSPNPLAQQTAE